MAKKQTEWSRAYNERAYDRLAITIPKGRKETVQEIVRSRGYESVNGLINTLLREAAGLTEEEWKRTEE
jgi:metal-responsive CopG/Arc/MetJ family transcriptional regulator